MNLKESLKTYNRGPSTQDAEWWASFFLHLGQTCEYDLLFHYLMIAQSNRSLGEIRKIAERIVRERSSKKVIGLKKTRGRKFGYDRVAA